LTHYGVKFKRGLIWFGGIVGKSNQLLVRVKREIKEDPPLQTSIGCAHPRSITTLIQQLKEVTILQRPLRSAPAIAVFAWITLSMAGLMTVPAFAQLAPTGGHYAGRSSDTGYGGTVANATGTFSATVPLDLPPTRGGLPIPLQIVYGARGVGAVGSGWDIPLSYIQHDKTFAHRRPDSWPSTLPNPRERTFLSLFGQRVELLSQSDGWVARTGTLELMVRENSNAWLAYDGNGRTYSFTQPAALTGSGMWLLDTISTSGGARVQLAYEVTTVALPGTPALQNGRGTAINLVRVTYNYHPTEGCAKNEIDLTYGNGANTPLSMSVLDAQILVREDVLTHLDVSSRADCDSPLQRLRRYDFKYGLDADTQLSQLLTVQVYGRQGTPEENQSLPIASYDYGSATTNKALQYQLTQTIALPMGVDAVQIAGTQKDSSANAPGGGPVYTMWQSLIDVTGDGRPDLVFKKNDKLWVAYNRPSTNGQTTVGALPQSIVQLTDSTFDSSVLAKHSTVVQRYALDAAQLLGPPAAYRNTVNVWQQAIDINGDGRIDIIDASEEAEHWVVYLNTQDPVTGGVKWQRRSFSVKALRETLTSEGHTFDSSYVPLSRRSTGSAIQVYECWKWAGTPQDGQWQWYPEGLNGQGCFGDSVVHARGGERTYVEWELIDLNGDGYPDFVFNSSPADFQGNKPATKGLYDGYIQGTNGKGSAGLTWQFFEPRVTNEVRASFNVLGVRFSTDSDPFAQSILLTRLLNASLGVEAWECGDSTGTMQCNTAGRYEAQNQIAGFADVNGDGLMDRVGGAGSSTIANLGVFSGTAQAFSNVYITLPGTLAVQANTHDEECGQGGNGKPTVDQTQGLRDVTGDGIPDYYGPNPNGNGAPGVWVGTGVGFRPWIPILVSGTNFRFSHETETCDGASSNTDGGLYDIDGDGRPEVISLVGTNMLVSQLAGGTSPGIPEAGRLRGINNGYGAYTRIGYVSAKAFTDSPVPFPEIVVSSVATTGTLNLGGTLSGSLYAYGNAALVFDSALDGFKFPGYGRVVELQLDAGANSITAAVPKAAGVATITNTFPLTPFSTGMTKSERWLRDQMVGRVDDVLTVRGVGASEVWSLLGIQDTDPRITGVTTYGWDAKLYEAPSQNNDIENFSACEEMVEPFDFAATLANSTLATAVDACRSHGFAFMTTAWSWYGDAAPPSDKNIQTLYRNREVDDFGRTTVSELNNDIYANDQFCVASTYAAPSGTFPRVLSAMSSQRVYDCTKDFTYANAFWKYDNLNSGSVADGRPTSHSVERRATDNGELLGTIPVFSAAYDSSGNLSSVTTQRQGDTRTVGLSYDPFELVSTQSRLEATGLPSGTVTVSYDPISLEPVSTTDVNQTVRAMDYDGFGRPVRSMVTPAAGISGVLSTTTYAGFDGTDLAGRRITIERFNDPVPLPDIGSATGRTGTVFLDELGRTRRSEVALGADYANDVLVISSRVYDGSGRVQFAADPYPKSQDAATAYGSSYYFTDAGDLDCVVRGQGPQPLNRVSDLPTERFPTCFQRSFAGHVNTLDVRDAASLQPTSPQTGVVRRSVFTAIGRRIEQSTLQNGVSLDEATFAFDRLGQQTGVTRFLDPVGKTDPVLWGMRFDSLGQMIQLSEPDAAIRNYNYSDWGEPVEMQWADGAIHHQVITKYDALARKIETEEITNGVTDPATIDRYSYDTGVTPSTLVSPTFVLGRMAAASSPTGQVAFSYDGFGHLNAQVFTDNQGGSFVEKPTSHFDGRLASLEFDLPDDNYAKELVKYSYDSAGRIRSLSYTDAVGTRDLYKATNVDPFGRVLNALYGSNTNYRAEYSAQGRRLTKVRSVESPQGSRLVNFEHFDAVGREIARRETVNGSLPNTETVLSYDALGRLAGARQTYGQQPRFMWDFNYDALGNVDKLNDLLGNSDAALSYETGDRDRICRIGYGNAGLGLKGGGHGRRVQCEVVHDAAGNITTEPTRTGSRQLSYFSSGSIRTIAEAGAQANFAYDAFGDVSVLDVQGGTSNDQRHDRRYGGLIEQRNVVSTGGTPTSIIARYIPGPGGIVASKRGTGGDWVFEFGEPRGNRFFTNQDGAFIQNSDYQPFGEATSTGAAAGSADYTSYQWNNGDALATFGVSQLGARIYDPAIGRFLSRDPLLIARTSSTSNPYAFAANDPFNAADPSGLDYCDPDDLCISYGDDPSQGNQTGGGPSRGISGAPQQKPLDEAPWQKTARMVIDSPHFSGPAIDDSSEENSSILKTIQDSADSLDFGLTLANNLDIDTDLSPFLEEAEPFVGAFAVGLHAGQFAANPTVINGAHLGTTGLEFGIGLISGPAGLALGGAELIGIGPNSMIDMVDTYDQIIEDEEETAAIYKHIAATETQIAATETQIAATAAQIADKYKRLEIESRNATILAELDTFNAHVDSMIAKATVVEIKRTTQKSLDESDAVLRAARQQKRH
jgi:RHS repeat-associated protein